MDLRSQQQENKDRFFQQFAGIQAVKNEISGNTYSPIGSFLDDLTASTWTAATQAERERVRALVENAFWDFNAPAQSWWSRGDKGHRTDTKHTAHLHNDEIERVLAALDKGMDSVDNSLA